MSAATASISDVSRTDTANKNDRNKSGKRDGIENQMLFNLDEASVQDPRETEMSLVH